MNTKILFAFFFVFFSLFSVTGVHAQQMTTSQCAAQKSVTDGSGGTCRLILLAGDGCNGKEVRVGDCEDGALSSKHACCVVGGTAATGLNPGSKYIPLEKIPFIESAVTFQDYVAGIYTVGLILIVLCAVFMLTIGGFTYLTSAGNTAAISSAKHIIYGSLIGLVLALVSYIILNTLNPDLVNVNISTLQPVATSTSPGGGAAGGGGGGGSVTSNLPAQEAAKKLLAHQNVTLGTSSGNTCPGGNASAKDNLNQVAAGKGMTRCPCGGGGSIGASSTLLNSLVDIANAGANFRINFIAGACHSGGSSHYGGTAVDIQRTPALDTFFAKYPKVNNGPTYQVSGVKVWFEDSSHYHVSLTGR